MTVMPDSFSSEFPPVRPIGIECEYHIEPEDGLGISYYISDKAIQAAGFLHIGQYLDDGSRVYPDVGHAEYATRECMGPYAAADQDVDHGIRTISAIVEASQLPHKGIYRISGTTLSTEPGKKSEYTNGVHENYMYPSRLTHDRTLRGILQAYLATRAWAMSGNVYDQHYEFSQKINGIGGVPIANDLVRAVSKGYKPMVALLPGNTDTMQSGEWGRGETRFADPGISREGRRLAIATHSLAYRLAEQQHLFEDNSLSSIALRDPLSVAKRAMVDLSLAATYATVEGEQVTMLDIQEKLASAALRLVELVQLPPDEVDAAHKWIRIVDALRRSKPSDAQYDPYLTDTFDVFAKHAILVKSGSFSDGQVAAGRSLIWDRVLPQGIGMKYWAKKTEATRQSADDPFANQPIAASAQARIDFIRNHHATANSVNWRGGIHDDARKEPFPLPWE